MSQDSGSNLMLASNLKLRGEDNYQDWKYNIENIARVHGLRRYYHPKAPTPPKFVDEFDDDVTEKDIIAFDSWARGDSKMKLCISNNVSASIASQVNRLSTAKEMWDMLANQYESSGIVLNQQAIARYIKIKYSDFSNMDEFIIVFQNAIDTLNRLEIPPPDSWHPLVFLEALKDSFPMWAERQRAACRGRSDISLSELVHDIKDEARAELRSGSGQMALYGNNQMHDKTRQMDQKRPKDMRKENVLRTQKNKELRNQWEKKHNKKWKNFTEYKSNSNCEGKANCSNDDEETPRFGGLACINLSGLVAKSSERWIFDTGASTHIANSLEKFNTYEEIDNLPKVITASGPVQPRGLGTITLNCKLSDGKTNRFELRDVLFLPECPVNLFSGDKLLKAKGYVRNGIMYGPDEIEFGTYDDSLYIIESVVTVAMPAQLHQPKLTIDLWHRRLGHLGLRNVKATETMTTGIAFEPYKL